MKNNDQEIFSISEFARLTNVTPETLRHYHRIGLLSPTYVNPSTGYRYYTMMEFETIGVIQALQSLGVSLNGIREYLDQKTFSYSYDLLSEQYTSICEQLESLSQAKKYLKEKIDTMDMIINNHTLNRVILKKIHKRRGYTNLAPCKNYKDYQIETAHLMETYNKNLFLSNSFAVICDYQNDSLPLQFYSLIMNIKKPKKIECKEKTFPSQLYLTLQFHGTFEDSIPSLKEAFKYINNNHYHITGDILMLCIVDENYTNIPSERITEIQIPISL